MTIVYEAGEDGGIVASIPEVPGTHSQGRTREEARANVIEALRGMLELRFRQHPSTEAAAGSESVEHPASSNYRSRAVADACSRWSS